MRAMHLLPFLVVMLRAASPPCSDPDHLKAGECYRVAGDWKRAEAEFREARNAARGSVAPTVAHAQSLVKLNQPFDALIELEDLLKHQPEAVSAAKLYAALCDTVLADHPKAKDVLEKTVALAPQDADIWMALGSHYLDLGDPKNAVSSFERARALNPSSALALSSLGYSYSQMEDSHAAAAMFAAALKSKEPGNATVFLLYGKYLSEQGASAEAARAFTRAIDLDAHLSQAFYERALLYVRQDKFEAAIADAQSALRESPERLDAHMILQRVYRRQGQRAKLEAEAQEILKVTAAAEREQALGRALRERLNLAEPLLTQQKFAEAIPHYEEIVRLLPNFYEAWFALGISYAQTGQPAKAETALRRYLDFQPLSPDGHAALGFLLQQQNRKSEAREQFEEALKLDPGLDEVRDGLAHL